LDISVSCVLTMEVNDSNIFLTSVFLVSIQWKSIVLMSLDISVSCPHMMEVNGFQYFWTSVLFKILYFYVLQKKGL